MPENTEKTSQKTSQEVLKRPMWDEGTLSDNNDDDGDDDGMLGCVQWQDHDL